MGRSTMSQYTSDGCTGWWNGFYNLFCDPCRDHDRIYELGDKSGLSRLQTDKELAEQVWASSYSPKLSWWQRSIVRANVPVMFVGVRVLGPTRFGPGQQWGYGDIY